MSSRPPPCTQTRTTLEMIYLILTGSKFSDFIKFLLSKCHFVAMGARTFRINSNTILILGLCLIIQVICVS